MKVIFKKRYSDESAYDLPEDVADALDGDLNELMNDVPWNDDGFRKGTFTVTITWDND